MSAGSGRCGSVHHIGLGLDSPVGVLWFWIGPHEEYVRLIKRS
ncbi:MAG TPA: hypothetical protein VGQ21_13455 [Thermoanaerobaculia bacterium]|nr:hypothetical protein [Thermoanaerobaculia bacterium]